MLSIYMEIYSWKGPKNISLYNFPVLQATYLLSDEVGARTLVPSLSVQYGFQYHSAS